MKKLFAVCAVALALAGCSKGCPDKEAVKASVKKIMPVEFDVVDVRPVKEVPGLCEVAIKLGAQTVLFYTDRTAKYLISGSIVEAETKKNLTMERQQAYGVNVPPPPAQTPPPVKKKK